MKQSVYALLISLSEGSRQQALVNQRAAIKLNDFKDDDFDTQDLQLESFLHFQMMNGTDATAMSSGCSKHHNNDASCLYKGANTGIKMTYDHVFTPPAPPPANAV